MITKEEQKRIEDMFKNRMITLKIKFRSKTFYNKQAAFFAGVLTAINEGPPYWSLAIQSGREIIEKYVIS